jgi:SAM-dependent methyltransferase
MTPERIRFYVNERISGHRHLWPLDWLQHRFPHPFRRALSIGCGTGALERDLVRRNLVASIDAFDGSIASVSVARRAAAEHQMLDRVRYFAADFNRPCLPKHRYDAVFIHQALHHVEKLERLFSAILEALTPGGVLYLDEYIGPSRTFWDEETVAPYRARFASYPRAVRRSEELPLPIQPDDPTEAFRSGEIVDQLAVGFVTEEFRGYGGAILSVIGPRLNLDALSEETLSDLIVSDRAADRDFYAIVVARPKPDFARGLAKLRYFIEPKLKRIGREARNLLRRLPMRPRETKPPSTGRDGPTI